jgi:hypothetical protein
MCSGEAAEWSPGLFVTSIAAAITATITTSTGTIYG